MPQSLSQVAIILEKHKFNFSNLPKRLKCVLCHEILKNAKQISCGCKVCDKCIISYLSDGARPCPSNQSDCMNVKLNIDRDIHQDNATNNEIGNLVVNCPFHKCLYSGALRIMVAHIESCEFREITCEQCANKLLSKEKLNHDKNKCEMRMVTCDYCSSPFSSRNLINIHLNADRDELCSKFVGICPNNCNETHKINLKEHLKICANKKLECPFHQFDCKIDKMTKEKLIEHMEDEYFDHTSSLVKMIKTLELKIVRLDSELDNQVIITKELFEMNKKSSESRLKIEETIKKHMEDEYFDHTSSLINKTKTLELKIFRLESELHNQVIITKELFEMNKKSSDSRLKIEETIKELKKKSSSSSPASQTVDYKNVIFRNASFIWKFTNFEVRRVDAESGGRVSVTSDPFYTSEFGYKMCLCVYPAGYGVGKGTHLSVFFAIMRGEFDDLLSWPFKQKVTLSILDQESGSKHHSDTLKPDSRSVCYQKPTDECNIASGYPEFILLSLIMNNSIYCKNDSIFLKIAVDTIGISNP